MGERPPRLDRLRADLGADALIEVAALVTDFDLNVPGHGVDLIIKPSAEALDQMNDFVREMHETSGKVRALGFGIRPTRCRGAGPSHIREHRP